MNPGKWIGRGGPLLWSLWSRDVSRRMQSVCLLCQANWKGEGLGLQEAYACRKLIRCYLDRICNEREGFRVRRRVTKSYSPCLTRLSYGKYFTFLLTVKQDLHVYIFFNFLIGL